MTSLLLLVLAIASLHLAGASPFPNEPTASSRQANCRCFPGDTCWPSKPKWDSLNSTVGGRLIATIPLASPCHTSTFGTYDESRCNALRAAWNDPLTHINTTHSLTNAPFFANQSCDPFLPPSSPCVLGTYVQYTVDATTAADYQAAIKFARENNIRLVIRNTAHDWLGKSTGAGALGLRTYNLKSIEVLDYKSSSYTGKALKVGAGVSLGAAFRTTHDSGLVNVGGTCPTVGLAGGYTQGGGHGLTVSKFGLAADQALEWEVITADGKLLKTTPSQNSDLYWALSGGGGGTYAAVVSLTIKVYKDQLTTAMTLSWSNAGISQDTFYAGIEAYVKALPAIVDAGASGNWLNSNTTFSVSPFVGVGMTKAQMDKLHQPVLSELTKLKINYTYTSAEFSTFLDMYTTMNPETQVGIFQIGSRLVPRSLLSTSGGPKNFTTALRAINEQAGAWVSGLAFDVSKKPAASNSVNPAWRQAIASVVIGTFYDYTNREANVQNQRLMTTQLVPQISRLIPGGGAAYLNEGDPWEPEWQRVFYGENYDPLLKIKKKYDPESLFYARTAVGSEAWVEGNDGRLCKT